LQGLIFPLNCPAWSLFLEVFINTFFFFFFAFIVQKRKRLQLLFFILTLSAPLYLFCAYRYGGLFGGWGESNFLVGLTRVTYHFFLGVGLSQIAPPKKAISIFGRSLGPLSICALFLIMSFIIPGGTWLGIFILAPLSVWSNLQSHWPDFLQPLFHWLGEISYPIYIVHYPIYAIGFLLLKNFSLASTTTVLLMTFISLAVASILNGFDKKIRQIISRG
jgi:peptidoglycan/LPS O-acetylase OafA/YrhL